jgi:hypothetical protein
MKKIGCYWGFHPLPLHHVLLFCALWLAGCQPSPQSNVLGYTISTWLGTQPPPVSSAPPGALVGRILDEAGRPIAGASVIVAQPDGLPHHALTDADGVYSIAGVPPGQYVPAAVAPGFAEAALTGLFGLPKLVTIRSNAVTQAPALTLKPYRPKPLPDNLAEAIHLRQTAVYTATAAFPENAAADVRCRCSSWSILLRSTTGRT